MAEGKKAVVQQAKVENVTIEKVSGSFTNDDGETIAYDKLTLVVDDLEFDIQMDSSVKKLFTKIVKFEDVTEA